MCYPTKNALQCRHPIASSGSDPSQACWRRHCGQHAQRVGRRLDNHAAGHVGGSFMASWIEAPSEHVCAYRCTQHVDCLAWTFKKNWNDNDSVPQTCALFRTKEIGDSREDGFSSGKCTTDTPPSITSTAVTDASSPTIYMVACDSPYHTGHIGWQCISQGTSCYGDPSITASRYECVS